MIEHRETRSLECLLTEDEVREKGEELAAKLKRIAELTVEKSRITAQIKPINEEVEELVEQIDTKKETRDVECVWIYGWELGEKYLVRDDTGEAIKGSKCSITEEERQMNL